MQDVSLEDIVLAYLSQQSARAFASAAIGARAERNGGAQMIWLTWRQHRAEGLIMLGVLALVGVFLLVTGLEMANSFQQFGLNNCLGPASKGSACA